MDTNKLDMKIVGINSHPSGSTKSIMVEVLDLAKKNLHADTYAYWGAWGKAYNGHLTRQTFGYNKENFISAALSRITGIHCCGSILGTYQLIRWLNKIKPDIIHLHNLHLWTINLPLLFWYIKKNNIKIVWTLHDCWAFTGHCTHFTFENCYKWKDGSCSNCPRLNQYPYSYIDRTGFMYKKKKEWFSGINEIIIVSPSAWLKKYTEQSFLGQYPIQVINNGINISIFKPTSNNFRKEHSINESDFVILGVAFGWGEKKGLDVFIKLANILDPTKYKIVLVGTDREIESRLPSSIITITRTESQKDLAKIYTAANLFVNPTREENYPTVNMESLACGTPVITFNTGGCAEIVNSKCGIVVPCNDIEAMIANIREIAVNNPFTVEECVKQAIAFDSNLRYKKYLDVYTNLLKI